MVFGNKIRKTEYGNTQKTVTCEPFAGCRFFFSRIFALLKPSRRFPCLYSESDPVGRGVMGMRRDRIVFRALKPKGGELMIYDEEHTEEFRKNWEDIRRRVLWERIRKELKKREKP